MKLRNLSLDAEQRRAASEQIFAAVEALPAFAAARCVAVFCSLADEPDTEAFLMRWSNSKQLFVPRVEGDVMRFYAYDPAVLATGAFGIAEPACAGVCCDPAAIDLIVVPGTAFTAAGERIGRGRGYYDKYLAQQGMRALRVGVCYAHQLVDRLPVEAHDVGMDVVCTE